MPLQVSDIIATVAAVWYAPLLTAQPAATLAVGAAWPAGWSKLGFTKEPLKLIYKYDVLDVKIQEALAAVRRRRISEEITLETVLAETSSLSLSQAFGGVVTNTAQYDLATWGGQAILGEWMYGFEGDYIDETSTNYPVRCVIYKATAAAGGELDFGKADYVGIPFKIAGLEDLTRVKGDRLFNILKVNAP